MGANIISGTIQLADEDESSAEKVFHRFLSAIKPEAFRLERMSVFEAPIRAQLIYAAKSRPDLRPELNVEFLVNERAIRYTICSGIAKPNHQKDKRTFLNRMVRPPILSAAE